MLGRGARYGANWMVLTQVFGGRTDMTGRNGCAARRRRCAIWASGACRQAGDSPFWAARRLPPPGLWSPSGVGSERGEFTQHCRDGNRNSLRYNHFSCVDGESR